MYFNYGPWLPKFLPSLFGRCPLAIVYINLEPGAISDTLSGVLAGLLNANTKPKVFWARNRSGMKPKTFCNSFFLRVECQVFGLGRYERSFEKQTTQQRNRLKYKNIIIIIIIIIITLTKFQMFSNTTLYIMFIFHNYSISTWLQLTCPAFANFPQHILLTAISRSLSLST